MTRDGFCILGLRLGTVRIANDGVKTQLVAAQWGIQPPAIVVSYADTEQRLLA